MEMWQKLFFSVVRLAKHKLIVSVDAVVDIELLATTLAGKRMATVLPKFVLARQISSDLGA